MLALAEERQELFYLGSEDGSMPCPRFDAAESTPDRRRDSSPIDAEAALPFTRLSRSTFR